MNMTPFIHTFRWGRPRAETVWLNRRRVGSVGPQDAPNPTGNGLPSSPANPIPKLKHIRRIDPEGPEAEPTSGIVLAMDC